MFIYLLYPESVYHQQMPIWRVRMLKSRLQGMSERRTGA